MPNAPTLDFVGLLRVLAEHDIDFIVVGGVSAALHGAPVTTYDLDIVHSRTPANIQQMLKALAALDAYYRTAPERRLRPEVSHLSSPGHQLLITRLGPLDLLGSIGSGRSYEDLLPHASRMTVAEGVDTFVLELNELIKVKEETADEKDRAVLPLLRRTLRERGEE